MELVRGCITYNQALWLRVHDEAYQEILATLASHGLKLYAYLWAWHGRQMCANCPQQDPLQRLHIQQQPAQTVRLCSLCSGWAGIVMQTRA